MEGGAYGAGKAGGAFDPHTLVRQPHTILRVVSWVRTAGGPRGWGGGTSTGGVPGRAPTPLDPAQERGSPRGAGRPGCRRPPLPGPWAGVPEVAGVTAPAPGALVSRSPCFPEPLTRARRPRRRDLQAAAVRLAARAARGRRADPRPWGRSRGFRWPLLGWIGAWIMSRGCPPRLPRTFQERAGNRIFTAQPGRCGAMRRESAPWLRSGNCLSFAA